MFYASFQRFYQYRSLATIEMTYKLCVGDVGPLEPVLQLTKRFKIVLWTTYIKMKIRQ